MSAFCPLKCFRVGNTRRIIIGASCAFLTSSRADHAALAKMPRCRGNNRIIKCYNNKTRSSRLREREGGGMEGEREGEKGIFSTRFFLISLLHNQCVHGTCFLKTKDRNVFQDKQRNNRREASEKVDCLLWRFTLCWAGL